MIFSHTLSQLSYKGLLSSTSVPCSNAAMDGSASASESSVVHNHVWDVPGVGIVHLVGLSLHEVAEPSLHLLVIRLILELKVPRVCQQHLELIWYILAEDLQGRRQLLLHDLLILLLLVVGFEILPWQVPLHKVQEHIGDAFDVIPPALLDAQVRVEGGVSGCAREVLVVPVDDVRVILLHVLLSQSEVDQVQLVAPLLTSHQEVIWLNVPMYELLLLHKLDPIDHLDGQLAAGLQVEPFVALVEEFLEGGAQEVHHEDVVLSFGAAEIGMRDALVQSLLVVEVVDQLRLVKQLRVFRVHCLALHRKVSFRLKVRSQKDLPKGPCTQLLLDLVGPGDSYVDHYYYTKEVLHNCQWLVKCSDRGGIEEGQRRVRGGMDQEIQRSRGEQRGMTPDCNCQD